MLETTIGKRKRNVPASWDELSLGQVLAILKALSISKSLKQAKLTILRALLDIPWAAFRNIRTESLAYQLRLTDFVFKQNTLTRQLLPIITVPYLYFFRKKLYGPGDNFKTITVWEFIFAERFFLAFHNKKEEKDLDYLIAVLYRNQVKPYQPDSPDFKGDIREPFNESNIKNRLRGIAQMPALHKQLVLTWYTGCRWKLTKLYPQAFEPPARGEKKKPSPNPWLDMLGDLPADKFGTIQEARLENLHTVLYFLNKMIKDSKEK